MARRRQRWGIVLAGLTLASTAGGDRSARAQGIGVVPDGVYLDATPAVTADRRYVRIGVNTSFNGFGGFQSFSVPAAVGGGGGGVGFGAGAGGPGGGVGPAAGGAGLFGPGAIAGGPTGPVDYRGVSSPFGSAYARFLDEPSLPTIAPPPRAARKKRGAPRRPAAPPAPKPAPVPARAG